MNTAIIGRRVEHLFRDYIEDLGWWWIRSAGSRGEADLVIMPRRQARNPLYKDQAWLGRRGVPILCDIKLNAWAPPADRQELELLAKDIKAYALLVNRKPGKLEALSPRWRFKWVVHPMRTAIGVGAQ